MLQWGSTIRAAIRAYGFPALRLRAQYEVRRRLSLYKATPAARLSAQAAPGEPVFRPHLDRIAAAADRELAIARADRVAGGEQLAYSHTWWRRPTDALAWSVHPIMKFEYPVAPWFELRRYLSLDPTVGDVKDAWEAGRFTWAFDLILGFAITRDTKYAESFWSTLESFRDGAPPFRNIQWTCGQETSIRALSCLWAEGAFRESTATTAPRVAALEEFLAWSGERVADAIGYGVSQRNNHGISEAAALVAIGTRLRGRHPLADRWRLTGKRWLEYLVADQFADDGWYIQHSFTYLRMALQQLCAAELALRASGERLSERTVARIRAAVALLLELHEPATGDVPNHGANDGTNVLPIAATDYRDFRPCITAAAAIFGVAVPTDFVASAEALAWIDARPLDRVNASSAPRVASGPSGWVSARNGRMRVFARAGEYDTNPSHLDAAHVDVWIDGRPVAIDAGTYRYTERAPWGNPFCGPEFHNTLHVPSLPAGVKALRFLWLFGPAARVTSARVVGDRIEISIENLTWQSRQISHARTLVLSADRLVVRDEVRSARPEDADVVLHWLVTDPNSVSVDAPAGAAIDRVPADANDPPGWYSLHYADKSAGVDVRCRTKLSATNGESTVFVTTFQAATHR